MEQRERVNRGVFRLLEAAVDAWIGRWSRPDPAATAAAGPLRPAVVVTGGSSGIGLAIAAEFFTRGRAVLLVARDEARLAAAVRGLVTMGPGTGPDPATGELTWLALDVAGPNAFSAIEAALGGRGWYLDVLVNSAACGLSGHWSRTEPAALDRLIGVNVMGLTRLSRSALPAMLARGRGGIINVSSLGGYVPGPNQAAYYASKAYVSSLTRAVNREIAGRGVRMMVLAPGPVETGFHRSMGADRALYRRLIPAISAERVAAAAVFGYALGHAVVVPGLLPRLLFLALGLLPNALTVPIVERLLASPSEQARAETVSKLRMRTN